VVEKIVWESFIYLLFKNRLRSPEKLLAKIGYSGEHSWPSFQRKGI